MRVVKHKAELGHHVPQSSHLVYHHLQVVHSVVDEHLAEEFLHSQKFPYITDEVLGHIIKLTYHILEHLALIYWGFLFLLNQEAILLLILVLFFFRFTFLQYEVSELFHFQLPLVHLKQDN